MNKFCVALLLGVIATGCSSTRGSRFELVEAYQLNDVAYSSYADYQKDVKARLKENWQALHLTRRSDFDTFSSNIGGVEENGETIMNRICRCVVTCYS